MKILWDEPKRLANLDKHGLDFADLTLEFFLESVIIPAKSTRKMAIGRMDRSIIAVVFLTLGNEAVSVMSMRPASRNERAILR
jgi:uncharacterized DUF497 family protein